MEIVDPKVKDAVSSAMQLHAEYAGRVIKTQGDYVLASDALKEIKTRGKQLDDLRRSLTKPLDDSKARIMDFFRKPADALAAAEKAIKTAMLRFQQEQARARLEEIRVQQENRRLEQEILAEMAAEAAQAGDIEEAEELTATQRAAEFASVALQHTTPPTMPKVDGIGTRKVWKWRLGDIAEVPREYLKLDEVMVGNVVRSSQGKLTIPGIEIYSEDVVTSRGI